MPPASADKLHYLRHQPVQVGVRRTLDVKGATADVVDCLVIEKDSNISVLQKRVGGQHRVVRLNNGGGHLWRGIHRESELGLLAVVNGQALEKKGPKTGASATTNGIEDKEALKTSAVVGKLADAVEAQVHDLLAN